MRCQQILSLHLAAATKMFICLLLRQLPGPDLTSGPGISGASLNRMVLLSSAFDRGRTPLRETMDAKPRELRAMLSDDEAEEPKSASMRVASTKTSSSSP